MTTLEPTRFNIIEILKSDVLNINLIHPNLRSVYQSNVVVSSLNKLN